MRPEIYTDQVLLNDETDTVSACIEATGEYAPDGGIIYRADGRFSLSCVDGIVYAVSFKEFEDKSSFVFEGETIRCKNVKGRDITVSKFLIQHPDFISLLHTFLEELFYENDDQPNHSLQEKILTAVENFIVTHNGIPLNSVEDWRTACYLGKKQKHWKDGQSAKSLAEFIAEDHGLSWIQDWLRPYVGGQFFIYNAQPEKTISIDSFGHGREHDLSIYAYNNASKTVFIGVEAKVDEPFGNYTAGEYYKKALASKKSTNVPQRIERLVGNYLPGMKPEACDIQYQLLTAAEGCLSPESDIHVMLILSFKGKNEKQLNAQKVNHNEFLKFVTSIKAQKVDLDVYKYLDRITNKELLVIYKTIGR